MPTESRFDVQSVTGAEAPHADHGVMAANFLFFFKSLLFFSPSLLFFASQRTTTPHDPFFGGSAKKKSKKQLPLRCALISPSVPLIIFFYILPRDREGSVIGDNRPRDLSIVDTFVHGDDLIQGLAVRVVHERIETQRAITESPRDVLLEQWWDEAA